MAQTSTENIVIPNVTIESVDTAFFRFIDEQLNLHCTYIDGWKKAPVIWSSAERAFQVKNNVLIRDENGTLIFPIISVERIGITKDLQKKGLYQANLAPQHNRIVIAQRINQEKTAKFANAESFKKTGDINFVTSKKNKKVVYDTISIPMPVYVTIEYKISFMTSYIRQMNELVHRLMTRSAALNYFTIDGDDTRFECFIDQEYTQESIAELEDNERKYKTEVKIKVLGHLIGDGDNQDKPQVLIQESAIDVISTSEKLIFTQPKEDINLGIYPINFNTPSPGATTSLGTLTKKLFTIGDGINSVFNLSHGLNTKDINVIIRENFGTYDIVYAGISINNTNSIEVDMGSIIPSLSYSVTIIG
jgi:hypothetical protein